MDFFDGATDVAHGAVGFGFCELFAEFVFEEDFPGGDVKHAVVELAVEARPLLGDEFAVVIDGVAGEVDGVLEVEMLEEEIEEFFFDEAIWAAFCDVLPLKGAADGGIFVPKVTDHSTLSETDGSFYDGFVGGNLIKVPICGDGGDLEDAVACGVEPGHFEVDPEEIGFFRHVLIIPSIARWCMGKKSTLGGGR